VLVQESLSPKTIEIADKAEDSAGVISLLSAGLAQFLEVEHSTIERAVLARERARTTAFANGASIPHCRLPGLKRFGIAVMILHQPIRWDNEGHAVDTVVMIAGPTENVSDHLRILANCSQLLESRALRAKLKLSPDSQSAYELISAAEAAVEERRSQDGMLRELRREQVGSSESDHLAEVAARFDW